MLGNTIELNIGTISVPELIELTEVNQDGYSKEYRLKEADREHVVLIRHTKENAKLKGKSVDRHNVTYTQNIFPTELAPLGETIQAYSVIRVNPERPNADSLPLVNAIMRFTEDNGDAILSWQS